MIVKRQTGIPAITHNDFKKYCKLKGKTMNKVFNDLLIYNIGNYGLNYHQILSPNLKDY